MSISKKSVRERYRPGAASDGEAFRSMSTVHLCWMSGFTRWREDSDWAREMITLLGHERLNLHASPACSTSLVERTASESRSIDGSTAAYKTRRRVTFSDSSTNRRLFRKCRDCHSTNSFTKGYSKADNEIWKNRARDIKKKKYDKWRRGSNKSKDGNRKGRGRGGWVWRLIEEYFEWWLGKCEGARGGYAMLRQYIKCCKL